MPEEVWPRRAGRPSTSGSGFRGRLAPPAQRLDSQLLPPGVEEAGAAPKSTQAKAGASGGGMLSWKRNIGLGLPSPLDFPMGS